VRLPTPHQLDSLVQLAAHDRPDVRKQALELCQVLAAPVRLLAAARLAERGAFLAAIDCAWPDAPAAAAALQAAVVRDCAVHVHDRWRSLTEQDDAFRRALALQPQQRTSARGIRRALEQAVRAHPSRTTYALAVIGMAVLEEDPAAGLAACVDHLPLATRHPEGAHPWLAARIRAHLAHQRPLSLADRSALALAFAVAVSETDSARAALVLSGGCAHTMQGQTCHGPDAILAACRERIERRRARFDAVERSTVVRSVTDEAVCLDHTDHHVLGSDRHLAHSQQRLWMDELGSIWRIEDLQPPG